MKIKIWNIPVNLNWIILFASVMLDLIYRQPFLILIYFIILTHELGHAFCGKLFGYDVQEVYVSPLFGYTKFGSYQQIKPAHNIIIAYAGPFVNFMTFGFVFLFASQFGYVHFVAWLGTIALIVCILNLMPIMQLDGGRALNSLLEMQLPKGKANTISAYVGLFFLFLIYSYITYLYVINDMSLFAFVLNFAILLILLPAHLKTIYNFKSK